MAIAVKSVLRQDLEHNILSGVRYAESDGIKSPHIIDQKVNQRILEVLDSVNCSVVLESQPPHLRKKPDFTVYIDPVDGSLNWDRGVGDPCIAIAIAEGAGTHTFGKLIFGYVEGFRSGDFYYTEEGEAWYFNSILGRKFRISTGQVQKLAESNGYIRLGYSGAEIQLKKLYPVLVMAMDIRGIENTEIEICEISKKAADFMIEARGFSDGFNLLAYPILKAAGGLLVDLEGNALADSTLDLSQNIDFIACSNEALLIEIQNELKDYWSSGEYNSPGARFSVNDL